MNKEKFIATLIMGLLILSTTAIYPETSATQTKPIILPFSTSWELVDPQGRENVVITIKDFSLPALVPRETGYVEVPSNDAYLGYDFGNRYLVAEGRFDSADSYCYFSLFDMTGYSDYNPPIKIRPHTFISIWYYHQGSIADCMIDAELYNVATHQHSRLSTFSYNGHYIVDQNGTRVHPAYRSNDPLNSWQFACFDLSIIYESDPENWYITAILVGFDNRNDGKVGYARTYFDMLHITYGVSNATILWDLYDESENEVTIVAASVIAWEFAHLPSLGGYFLYLKVSAYAFSNETWIMPPDWYSCYVPEKLFFDANRNDAAILQDPPPTGNNLTSFNETWTPPKVWEYVFDGCLLVAGVVVPHVIPGAGHAITAIEALILAGKFMGLMAEAQEPERTYEWPEGKWDPFFDGPGKGIAGGAYVEIQSLPQGTHNFSFDFTAGFGVWYSCLLDYFSVTVNFSWTTEPDTLPPGPGLATALNTLGFINLESSTAETFSPGIYEVKLYAEFAGYYDFNDLSWYPVGTANYNLIFSGADGGYGYIKPPVTKTFKADTRFGLSLCTPEHRYFTETSKNPDGLKHAQVYVNLDNPDMYLIGLENLYGQGDKDFDDMIISLEIINKPPNIPCKPDGPTSGYTDTSYTYSTCTTDPDGDDIYYIFDWDDGSTTTIGPYPSGVMVSASHTWSSEGTYNVRVRAKDINGLLSDWSESLMVTISSGGGGGGGGCPTLFSWNGTAFTKEALLDIHASQDVTVDYTLKHLTPIGRVCMLQLRELDNYTSHIDYVKLYAVDSEGNWHECQLILAWHSQQGPVTTELLHDDSARVDLAPQQQIQLIFLTPKDVNINNIQCFIFELNGCNWKALLK